MLIKKNVLSTIFRKVVDPLRVLMMQHGNDISPIQHVASIDHSSKRSLQRWMVGSGFGGFRSRPQQKTQKTLVILSEDPNLIYMHM